MRRTQRDQSVKRDWDGVPFPLKRRTQPYIEVVRNGVCKNGTYSASTCYFGAAHTAEAAAGLVLRAQMKQRPSLEKGTPPQTAFIRH